MALGTDPHSVPDPHASVLPPTAEECEELFERVSDEQWQQFADAACVAISLDEPRILAGAKDMAILVDIMGRDRPEQRFFVAPGKLYKWAD